MILDRWHHAGGRGAVGRGVASQQQRGCITWEAHIVVLGQA